MKELIQFLQSLGDIQPCKKQGAQGIMIYEPSFYDKATLKALCNNVGFTPMYNKADDKCDANRLFIGKVNKEVYSAEEAENFLSGI